MNKYHLDVITGVEIKTGSLTGRSWGGTKSYVIEATNYAIEADTYIFWNQEQTKYGELTYTPVARFPISRTIIANIETPIPDDKANY